MRVLRRSLLAALGAAAVVVVLALVFGGPVSVVAIVAWVVIFGVAFFSHYRSGSKMEAWERAKAEAEREDADAKSEFFE